MAEYNPMQIACHGGNCCGIKTIHYFSHGNIKNNEPTLKKHPPMGDHTGKEVNYYHLDAPAEPAKERLERYLSFLHEHVTFGLVEVVLIDNRDRECRDEYYCCEDEDQATAWEPVLLEHGFNKVTTFLNGNSDNNVSVYHLVMDETWSLGCGLNNGHVAT